MTSGRSLDALEAGDRAAAGAKAARLSVLRRAGLPVPAGWVVGVTDDPRESAAAAVAALRARSWAVRSSAPDEDGHEHSQAGANDSELAVTDAGLPAAISRVRRAATGPIPVLLMPAIRADWAGVAFTADPVDGGPDTVIEAVAGSTSAATAGTADPHRFRIGPGRQDVDRPRDGPAADVLARVAALARSAAALAGEPQDVEWAAHDDQVWLLQARPITARQLPIAVTAPPRQRWELSRDHRWRPPYPLEHSVWAPCLERSMRRALETVGAPVATMEQRLIGGWAYHRLRPLGGANRDDSASPPAWLTGLMARVIPQLRSRLATAARAAAGDPGDRLIEEWEGAGRRLQRDRTDTLRRTDLRALDNARLATHLDTVLDHLQAAADAHAELPLATTYLRLGQLGVWCRDNLGWDDTATLAAITLARGPAPSPIADLARRLEKTELALLRAGDFESARATLDAGTAVAGFVQAHGQRTFGVDLATPTWHEDPIPLLALLAHAAAGSSPRSRGVGSAVGSPEELRPEQRETYHRLLERAVTAAHYGDQTETDVLDALALVRATAMEAGRRFRGRAVITNPADVLYLTIDEVSRVLQGHEGPADLDTRRAQYRWAVAHPGPAAYGPPPGAMPDLTHFPRPGAEAWTAMLWAVQALEGEPPPAPTSSAFRGIGAAAGRACGPVRVVRGSADFPRVRPGDILVCHSTLASWAVLFPMVAGVVSEVGGALSHPAILAREHGLPAVVGVSGVLAVLADGDIVSIDGLHGTIERL